MIIQFSPKTTKQAVGPDAPVVGQYFGTITDADGTTPITTVTAATGTAAFSEAVISNPGCAPIRATVSYLTGGDCDGCTVDTLTVSTVDIDVPGFVDSFPLPYGAITNIDIVPIDVPGPTGVPTAVVKDQDVMVYAKNDEQCVDCKVLVP